MKKLKSAEECVKEFDNIDFAKFIRQIQIDAIKTTVENCAENTSIITEYKYNPIHKENDWLDIVDKQSILNVADKMIEEL